MKSTELEKASPLPTAVRTQTWRRRRPTNTLNVFMAVDVLVGPTTAMPAFSRNTRKIGVDGRMLPVDEA